MDQFSLSSASSDTMFPGDRLRSFFPKIDDRVGWQKVHLKGHPLVPMTVVPRSDGFTLSMEYQLSK